MLKATPRASTLATTVIDWEFTRGNERLSCQVARESDQRFTVGVVPYQRLSRATSAIFGGPASALHHHAMLAAGLRENGWKLVGYTH